ncbi:coiled-coil domain-containing 25 [Basidiobolus meristosporus CBS 931.73]|uniref:Coiled-coil domain-containing 25 n=1 Tax=Basidiobolus meristosporus CBS 931.73 TaxID=1314790 RepID=A0A1Y1YY01_9FUNG|nr:coiled-coil domain-containing 25 [Basidiobolus meristosporus CBS 931.73]|eukprot:ORY02816.1 coiled-coil domain-containing 25 [Basidiobolus meristosporus CBS 931.73]
MVLYFTSKVVNPPALIYMGKDKYENESLIKYGWDRDVWFHVDKLSSAHVYLRLNPGDSWENIPEDLLNDLGQLVKANSIEGNKKNDLTIIYTPWSNLKKTGDMATGQVSFHNQRLVKRVYIEKRVNEIVNRLEKTKQEKYPDLQGEREDYEREKRKALRIKENKLKEEEKRKLEEQKKMAELKTYSNIFKEEEMRTNQDYDNPEDFEDDFM